MLRLSRTYLLAIAMLLIASQARAQKEPQPVAQQANKPSILNDVGIDQKLYNQIPSDLLFVDESGKEVRLSTYFNGKRPIVLSLVYYKCPMLCTMVLNDLNHTITAMPGSMNVGEQFDILTVSFDPKETSDLAAKKKDQYIRAYARPHAAEGWHFLTGDAAQIKQLTDAVGFRYAWDPKFQQYAHASGIMVLTPEGKVSKYFFGVEYSAQDLRLALAEAGGGKISAPVEQILLYCFHYDPTTGRYSLAITRALKVAGILTIGSLGAFWFFMYRRDHSKRASV
jgi:protein SCO1/2